LKKLLSQHIERIERKVEKLKALSNRISTIRLLMFIGILIFAVFTASLLPVYIYASLLFGYVIAFCVVIDRHRKVEQCIEKLGILKQIKSEQVARIDLKWDEIPWKDINRNGYENHPYAHDLNIIGKKSLFQLMDTSIYEGSVKILSEKLLNQNRKTEVITEIQSLVQELAPLQLFRDKLRVEAKYTDSKTDWHDWTMEQMLDWLRLPKKTGFILPIGILSALSILNITFGIMALLGNLSAWYVMISFVSYLIVHKLNSHKVNGLFDAAFQMEKLLGRFSNILTHVERFKVRGNKKLVSFLEVFQKENEKPSKSLRKVRRLAIAASVQKNQIIGPILNLLMPWDFYFCLKLEDLKKEIEPKLTKWLDSFYELEALNSIANFCFLNPEYSFPTFKHDSKLLFKAEQMGHPLIHKSQKVDNDFEIKSGNELFLLTGSNMAGKSTFLRTVGINLVLTYTGAPVSAVSLQTDVFRIFTSINVNDSLGDGLSHFYAEVKRLRKLLDELQKQDELPLFFFVDEIYKGTNNRERYSGSVAFLKEVAKEDGIGIVSTHDLELADLESEIKKLSNWHFAESIMNGKMSFEYKLRSGPCPSTNALQIMKLEGLPVE